MKNVNFQAYLNFFNMWIKMVKKIAFLHVHHYIFASAENEYTLDGRRVRRIWGGVPLHAPRLVTNARQN